MDELISIIVPIYNVEEYLPRCLNSLISQDYDNLEIILVDDGSTDKSAEICNTYARYDCRIKAFHKENGGVSSARNFGLKRASGNWIGFVDADDYIQSNMYSKMALEIPKTSKLIISCAVMVEDIKGNEVPHLSSSFIPTEAIDLSVEDSFRYFLNPMDRFLYWSPWDKIFHYSILQELLFEEGRKYAEDFDFCVNCILNSTGIRYLPEKLYHYVGRPNSAINSIKVSQSLFDGVYFADKAVEKLKKHQFPSDIIILAKVFQSYSAITAIRIYYRESKDIKLFEHEINQCKNRLKTNYKCVHHLFYGKRKALYISAMRFPLIFKVLH